MAASSGAADVMGGGGLDLGCAISVVSIARSSTHQPATQKLAQRVGVDLAVNLRAARPGADPGRDRLDLRVHEDPCGHTDNPKLFEHAAVGVDRNLRQVNFTGERLLA